MATKPKLELTWVGKETRPRLEPRILIEDPAKSHHAAHRVGESDLFDNKLIFGDNLLALKALQQEHRGKIKLIYIDPPFNTGQAFAGYYDDGLEHSLWLSLMRWRLEILHTLLSPDGSLFVEIDDTESSYLQVILDEVFGRANRIGTIAIKRSAATGHKAINPSPINVTEYIHAYAKDKSEWKYKPQYVARGDYDKAYSIRLANRGDSFDRWTFAPLADHVAKQLGHANAKMAKKEIGAKAFDEAYVSYALRNADEVVRFAQPDYKAVSKAAREMIDRSKATPGSVFLLHREEHSDMYFLNGNRILFLSDKVDGDSGEGGIVEPLTNWWGDIPWQGIAGEGGVDFPKNKKPEKLIARIMEMGSQRGDLVLDSFAGSGTTGAVAHKLGRRWIMIELGEHCQSLIMPRMKRVIDGADQTGISKQVGWKGGGGFRYYKLAPSLLEKDKWGNWVINKEYNAAMLAEALCKLEGFTYAPSETEYFIHGHSTESDFIWVTTQNLGHEQLAALSEDVGSNRTLLVLCSAYRADTKQFPNLTIKKIPNAVLSKCEWGHDDYSLQVENLPAAPKPKVEQPDLFGGEG